jgi:hypothetical protein
MDDYKRVEVKIIVYVCVEWCMVNSNPNFQFRIMDHTETHNLILWINTHHTPLHKHNK